MHAITDSAQDAILMMDPEGRISYWNPAAERILGYTSAEAIGQNLHALIAPSRYHEAYHAALPVFHQKGQGAAVDKTLDLEAHRKDGKEISVQLSLSAIHMKSAWHAVGILRDITDRRLVEEALQKSEESKRLLLHAVGDGIFGVDATGQVTFVNPAALRMLGFSVEEMLGQNAHALIHHSHKDGSNYPDEDCPMYASYTQATENHVTDEMLWRKDGSSFPVEYSSMPIINDGKVMGAVVTFRDITKRKQAEEALHRSEEKYRTIIENI